MKVLCKKDTYIGVNDRTHFKKGEYYILFEIDYWVMNDNCFCYNFRDKFSEYFYTQQELRQMKLKKLYEENISKD